MIITTIKDRLGMFPPSDLKPFIPVQHPKRRKRKVIVSESDRVTLSELRQKLFTEQASVCYYCKLPTPASQWTVEHKQPLCRGGSHGTENIVGACTYCNNEKGDLTEAEYKEALRVHGHVGTRKKKIPTRFYRAPAPAEVCVSQEWQGARFVRGRVAAHRKNLVWQEHYRQEVGRLLSHAELRGH